MQWEAVIEPVRWCTWRPRWNELRDELGGRDWSSLEMHRKAVIERVTRCTRRPRLTELEVALGGRDWASLDIHLEAVIEWTETCTLKLWPSEFGDAFAGYDGVRLETYLEAVDLEGGATAAETLSIGELVNGWETGWERETVDLGVMLYLVYAVLGVHWWLWHGERERDDLISCS